MVNATVSAKSASETPNLIALNVDPRLYSTTTHNVSSSVLATNTPTEPTAYCAIPPVSRALAPHLNSARGKFSPDSLLLFFSNIHQNSSNKKNNFSILKTIIITTRIPPV